MWWIKILLDVVLSFSLVFAYRRNAGFGGVTDFVGGVKKGHQPKMEDVLLSRDDKIRTCDHWSPRPVL